tara:strand:+ start:395 stop:697 length:303 start_codon:yes stop_codon:yes gene_type:complete
MPKNYDTYRWVIVPVSVIDGADVTEETEVDGETRTESSNVYIDSCIQSSKDTLRLSVDGTQALLKWKGETPEVLASANTFNHSEILVELAKPEWTPPTPE